ncbi:MAG: tRNA (N6-threonylcarbamoyladenosine(37)-N6)-methyltransferase TrmO [bacterium]
MSDRPYQPYSIEAIGVVHSPYQEKFGIPRQPGLVESVRGEIELIAPFDDPEMVDALSSYSHIWVTFLFHECLDHGWKKRVRPPRLGGNRRVGVFSSRSPFRPNHLGLSVVRLHSIDISNGVRLTVSGHDMLDGTPVMDIRPYVPYVDAVSEAQGGFAPFRPETLQQISFSSAVEAELAQLEDGDSLRAMLVEILALDPRPAYHTAQSSVDRVYGMRFSGMNIRWQVDGAETQVVSIEKTK